MFYIDKLKLCFLKCNTETFQVAEGETFFFESRMRSVGKILDIPNLRCIGTN